MNDMGLIGSTATGIYRDLFTALLGAQCTIMCSYKNKHRKENEISGIKSRKRGRLGRKVPPPKYKTVSPVEL